MAKEKFREISEAYQILSDKDKRQNYDIYGHQENQLPRTNQNTAFRAHKFDFHDAEDIFARFFQQNPFEDDFFQGFFGKKKNNKNPSSSFGSRSGFSSFEEDPFFSQSFGGGFGRGFGGGLFRAQSLFENDDFLNAPKGKLGVNRASSFGYDMNTDHYDSHPGLSKSISTTTRTM